MCPEASHLLRDPGQDVASYGKLLMTFRAVEWRTGSLTTLFRFVRVALRRQPSGVVFWRWLERQPDGVLDQRAGVLERAQ